MSDNNVDFEDSGAPLLSAKFALVVGLVLGTGLAGCAAYTPATATAPVTLPLRLTGRDDAMVAAMLAAAKHQELTVVGAPRVEGNQTTFMLLGTGDRTGVAVVTKVSASAATGESDVVLTANVKDDDGGVIAGRLAADFRQRWEQLRRTGFAPLPTGWQ